MKFISYILSLYLILLSGFPCSDSNEPVQLEHELSFEEAHNHAGDNCADDHCSPFCICSCCHIQVNLVSEDKSFSTEIELVSEISFSNGCQENFKNRYPHSVFRPPVA